MQKIRYPTPFVNTCAAYTSDQTIIVFGIVLNTPQILPRITSTLLQEFDFETAVVLQIQSIRKTGVVRVTSVLVYFLGS